TPSSAGVITVTGNVTINPGSTLTLTPVPNIGPYTVGTIYNVIQTPGVLTGTFSSFTTNNPLFSGHLFYTNNNVFFELDKIGLGPVNVTGNSSNVATALNTIVGNGITIIDTL